MILACQNISKSFGVEPVIRNVSFHVEDQEKVAIVGINGAGKSTLLKIIVGELPADEGTVTLAKGKTLGYLAQHQDMDDARTIYETVLEGKRQLIDMEQKIRELEEGMQSVSKEEMESFKISELSQESFENRFAAIAEAYHCSSLAEKQKKIEYLLQREKTEEAENIYERFVRELQKDFRPEMEMEDDLLTAGLPARKE